MYSRRKELIVSGDKGLPASLVIFPVISVSVDKSSEAGDNFKVK